MRVLLQRVTHASVRVEGKTISESGPGLVILLGVGHNDGEEQAKFLVQKISTLRMFEDPQGKTNLSILDINGSAIVVSQFTLYADMSKGRRPSFLDAALPETASPLVDRFVELLASTGVPTQKGEFGANMLVEIHNDGPFTIWLEKQPPTLNEEQP
jgi:D-tyrosyl-tRNA(Tyr) deacylase